MGIINAIVKKPKIDAKRLKAEAYFNSISPKQTNKKANRDMPRNHARDVFWTSNRLKILFSALIVIAAAYFISCNFLGNSTAFLLLAGYTYLITPAIGYFANTKLRKKIKKVSFVKIGEKVYRQAEVPSGFIMFSLFSTWAFVGILKLASAGGIALYSICVFPFIMYHLLCFIGDHPLTIWKAIEFDNRDGHYRHNFSHDQGYDFNHRTSESSPMVDTRTITNFGATGSAAAYTFDQNSFDRIWND